MTCHLPFEFVVVVDAGDGLPNDAPLPNIGVVAVVVVVVTAVDRRRISTN